MPARKLGFPVFDADNHMYETPDAFTRYLPKEYDGLIKYVQVKGRTKIAVKNLISDYIPNPTFERVAAPGAQEEYFKVRQPRGQVPTGDPGPGHRRPARLLQPRAPPGPDGRARPRPGPHVAHAGQPARGADPRRSPAVHAVVHALEPVDARALDLQLRGPDVPHPRHPPGHRRPGHRGVGVGAGAGGEDHPDPSGARGRLHGSPFHRPARVRPLLGQGGRGRHPGRHARLGQRLPALPERVGGRPGRRDDPVQGRVRLPGHRRPPGPAHHRHGGLAHRTRPVLTLPDPPVHPGGERQQLGPAPAQRHGARLGVQPQRLRGAPGRGVPAQHLRAPVPRGGPEGPDRDPRCRPGPVRLGLPPPRRAGRPGQLRRRSGRPARGRHQADHGRQPQPSDGFRQRRRPERSRPARSARLCQFCGLGEPLGPTEGGAPGHECTRDRGHCRRDAGPPGPGGRRPPGHLRRIGGCHQPVGQRIRRGRGGPWRPCRGDARQPARGVRVLVRSGSGRCHGRPHQLSLHPG